MIFHNNLVATPVKAAQLNNLFHSINKGICRPITYSYYVSGSDYKPGDSVLLGIVPITTKLNPTIVYEVVSRGSLPDDYERIYNNTKYIPLMISPYIVLHAVASVPDGDSGSNGYSSKGLNGKMLITPGEKMFEEPQFKASTITAVTNIGSVSAWHFDFGLVFQVPPAYETGDTGGYKDDFVASTAYIVPSFVINITVYYKQGVAI